MTANDKILDVILRDATIEVFGHYGIALRAQGSSPALSVDNHDAVGVIGFTGQGVRGTLVIATSSVLVSRMPPVAGMLHIPLRDRIRDWVGELSNLVLGRIKVGLGNHGISVGLSTPVAFTGEHLRLGAVQPNRTRSWDFASQEGAVRTWLEAEFEENVLLVPTPGPDLEAGEPILF